MIESVGKSVGIYVDSVPERGVRVKPRRSVIPQSMNRLGDGILCSVRLPFGDVQRSEDVLAERKALPDQHGGRLTCRATPVRTNVAFLQAEIGHQFVPLPGRDDPVPELATSIAVVDKEIVLLQ